MRCLGAESCLHELPHKRVVNSAYFSPLSGSKIITTSIDNRIRVWDSIFGNLDNPSREIVHSHDFNRHLTPFRAEWDPKVIFLSYFIYYSKLLYARRISYVLCQSPEVSILTHLLMHGLLGLCFISNWSN